MVIGIDASRANQNQKTGIGWYSYHLIRELKKIPLNQGDKFILYSPNELKDDLARLPENWQSRILNWPLKYLWTQIRLAWEMLINPPDILFVPAHCLPVICPVKSIMTIHDIGFKHFKKAYSFSQRLYLLFVHWWAVKYADKIIVPTEFTKRELEQNYTIKDNKITVIYEGYDRKNFYLINNDKDDPILENKLKPPYFLYVGRLETKKNIRGLIEAYNKLLSRKANAPELVLIGPPGYGYIKIRDKIKENKNIKVLNYVVSEDLTFFYNQAVALIFPSFYEGFGLPVLEAMACGCPVIASRAGSLPEIGSSAALYFSPDDMNGLAELMEKMIEDKNIVGRLKQSGLERVKSFSWGKCAGETYKIFSQLNKKFI